MSDLIVKEFCTINQWATQLYKWYYTGLLQNQTLLSNLTELFILSPKKIISPEPKTMLESIYLFDDYKISFFKFQLLKYFQFENSLYLIRFVPNKKFTGKFKTKFDTRILVKEKNIWINLMDELGHHFVMEIDSIYEKIIEFINSNSQQVGWLKK